MHPNTNDPNPGDSAAVQTVATRILTLFQHWRTQLRDPGQLLTDRRDLDQFDSLARRIDEHVAELGGLLNGRRAELEEVVEGLRLIRAMLDVFMAAQEQAHWLVGLTPQYSGYRHLAPALLIVTRDQYARDALVLIREVEDKILARTRRAS